jgi:hypothetical protein
LAYQRISKTALCLQKSLDDADFKLWPHITPTWIDYNEVPGTTELSLRHTLQMWQLPICLTKDEQIIERHVTFCFQMWKDICDQLSQTDGHHVIQCFGVLHFPVNCLSQTLRLAEAFNLHKTKKMMRDRMDEVALLIPTLLQGGLTALETSRTEYPSLVDQVSYMCI